MDFCAVKKKKKKKKKISRSNMNFLIGVPNTEYTCCPVGWLGEAMVSCILHHRGIQMLFAYSWARPVILAEGKGRGGIFFTSSVSSSPLLSLLSLFSLSLGDDTK